MSSISRISLPDGNNYFIVPNYFHKMEVAGSEEIFFPLLAYTEGEDPDTFGIVISNSSSSPSVGLYGGALKAKMYVEDISDKYTTSKTSGNWYFAPEDVSAHRTGNVVHINIPFRGNGTAVVGPTNALVGELSGGPLPVELTTLIGYYNAVPVMAQFDTDGSLIVRPMGSLTITSTGRVRLTGTFITNT